MMLSQMSRICASVVALVMISGAAFAQSAPPTTGMKQIGVTSTSKPEIVPSLIVLNSHGATLQGTTLTLAGVSANAIIFADRPVRAAGHALTEHLIEEWAKGSDSFAKDPPNATISVLSKEASSVKDAVVELTSPKMDGANLTFNVKVLEGDLAGADGPASLFIDIIGLPFTPMSFAGVARRTAYRAAFYGGAAAAADPYYRPYAYGYPYAYGPRPACGYYPYPPCY